MSQRGRGAQCPLCQCVAGRGALCAACINSAAAPQRAALAGLQAQRQALHDRLAQLLEAKARRLSLPVVGAGQGAREPARRRPTNAAARALAAAGMDTKAGAQLRAAVPNRA